MKRWIPLAVVAGLWLAVLSGSRAWGFQGAACMTGNPAASATCSPGLSYGVTVTTSPILFLDLDKEGGARNCIQLFGDPNNTVNVCVGFGVTASVAGAPNCMQLVPGSPYWVFNLSQGNGATIVPNVPLSAVTASGSANLVYSYCR